MAIFPKCSFQVLVPNGHIVAGQRLDAVLVVTAAEPIPRAEGIDLLFQSVAWASYGKSGVSKVMFQAPLELKLDNGVPFAAGEHRYAFAVDIPAWLPPELNGGTFGNLSLSSNATLAIGMRDTVYGYPRDRRATPMSRVRIPGPALRAGETLSFTFPSAPHLAPTYRTSFIDHDVTIIVSIPTPWSTSASFEVPIEILPAGSIVQGSLSTSLLGGDRLRRIAIAMANDTGLTAGTHAPVLVHGDVGAVNVSMIDAPRQGKLGIDVDLTFPDLELGIVLRKRGAIEGIVGSPTSPFLPLPLWDRHLSFKSSDERPKVADASLGPLFDAALGGDLEEIRLSDHHLGFHVSIIDDEPQRMVGVARDVCAQAKRIGAAILALPFPEPLAESRPAWQATAEEQNAFLVPSTPAIHGLVLRAQIMGGEERAITVNLSTIWKSETPTLQATLDLRNMPLPEASQGELENENANAWLTAVRAIFPEAHATANGQVVALSQAKWPADPRSLLPALETFFGWILEARGERRVDAPYR